MIYTLAVEVNPASDKLPFKMLINNIDDNTYKRIITNEFGVPFCPSVEGDNYDTLRNSGIQYIEANRGKVTIVRVEDFYPEIPDDDNEEISDDDNDENPLDFFEDAK